MHAVESPLPEGWETRDHEGTVFYKNVDTGEKSWVHPSEIAAAAALPAGWEEREHEGTVFYKNVETGEKSWVHPNGTISAPSVDEDLPTGWETRVSDEGHTYYKHVETLRTQWTHPTLPSESELPAGWEIREHGGATFFKNVETSEKSWVHPGVHPTVGPTAAAAAHSSGATELAQSGSAGVSDAPHSDVEAAGEFACAATPPAPSGRNGSLHPRAPTYLPDHAREGAARRP